MSHDPARRMRQLQRILLLIELLSPLRYGATIAELASDISDDLGKYHERTIRRDLEALEIIGMVESKPEVGRDRRPRGKRPSRWFWRGSQRVREAAETAGQTMAG